jgi:hypothetical protein
MRKFFSQKSKHKANQHQTLSTTTTTTSSLTGQSSLVVSPLPLNKDDEIQTISTGTKKSKVQATSSHSQILTTNSTDILLDSTSNESISSELKQDENIEKSKKLFVVVSGKYNIYINKSECCHFQLMMKILLCKPDALSSKASK